MKDFKKYPKVHRLGKEETEGILEGSCYIQEKIDGANTSIWQDKGELILASRTRILKGDESFNGFRDYVSNHEGIQKILKEFPDLRLYGEWLVRHTIQYNETSYKKFYLFDITTIGAEDEEFWLIEDVNDIADDYGIDRPEYFGLIENPEVEALKELVGKSSIGERGEGITIKNPDFKDKWGDNHYAKIVTEKFKEDNGITFGGNNKHSDTYYEMYVVNKYMTLARVEKIMNKLQPEIDERLDLKHIPRISGTAYHDMLTEEVWEISKKVTTLNFRVLQRIAYKKAIQIYKDIIIGDISVADKK